MEVFGLGDFCHLVDEIDVRAVVSDVDRALAGGRGISEEMIECNRRLSSEVERRFREVLDEAATTRNR